MKTYQASLREIVAIKCIDCMCGDTNGILECTSQDCPLLSARPKGRPDSLKAKYWSEDDVRLKAMPLLRKREMTDEQKEAATARLAKARAA